MRRTRDDTQRRPQRTGARRDLHRGPHPRTTTTPTRCPPTPGDARATRTHCNNLQTPYTQGADEVGHIPGRPPRPRHAHSPQDLTAHMAQSSGWAGDTAGHRLDGPNPPQPRTANEEARRNSDGQEIDWTYIEGQIPGQPQRPRDAHPPQEPTERRANNATTHRRNTPREHATNEDPRHDGPDEELDLTCIEGHMPGRSQRPRHAYSPQAPTENMAQRNDRADDRAGDHLDGQKSPQPRTPDEEA